MIKFLETKSLKKRVFNNTLTWKNFGLYYSLPISYKYKLKFPEFKLSYRFRGYYYEKVVEDNIYSYSSGFQKDSFERLKNISMLKKHRRRLWVDDKNEYLPYTLCDTLKISYKDNNVLRFVTRYKIIETDFWMFNFFPRKNYRRFISEVLKKERLFNFFYKISKLTKKKLYSFFKGNLKVFLRKKDRIFLIKVIWKSPKVVFLTSSGYRFIRTGLKWLNLGIFTGLFYIIKGNAKIAIVKTLVVNNAMFIYYHNLFLHNIKNVEIYLNLLLYAKYAEFITAHLLETTYIEQEIKFRRSNRLLTRFHFMYTKTFLRVQVKYFNYFKTMYLYNFNNLKLINNYFLYSKYFECLNTFENSLFKDRNKLFFTKDYTLQEKALLFRVVVHLLYSDFYRTKVKYLTLRNVYDYLIIGSEIFSSIFSKIYSKKIDKVCTSNQFYFEGFILNNFIFNIYLNSPLSKRRRVWNFSFVGKKKKIMTDNINYYNHKDIFISPFYPKKYWIYIILRKFLFKRIFRFFFKYKKYYELEYNPRVHFIFSINDMYCELSKFVAKQRKLFKLLNIPEKYNKFTFVNLARSYDKFILKKKAEIRRPIEEEYIRFWRELGKMEKSKKLLIKKLNKQSILDLFHNKLKEKYSRSEILAIIKKNKTLQEIDFKIFIPAITSTFSTNEGFQTSNLSSTFPLTRKLYAKLNVKFPFPIREKLFDRNKGFENSNFRFPIRKEIFDRNKRFERLNFKFINRSKRLKTLDLLSKSYIKYFFKSKKKFNARLEFRVLKWFQLLKKFKIQKNELKFIKIRALLRTWVYTSYQNLKKAVKYDKKSIPLHNTEMILEWFLRKEEERRRKEEEERRREEQERRRKEKELRRQQQKLQKREEIKSTRKANKIRIRGYKQWLKREGVWINKNEKAELTESQLMELKHKKSLVTKKYKKDKKNKKNKKYKKG